MLKRARRPLRATASALRPDYRAKATPGSRRSIVVRGGMLEEAARREISRTCTLLWERRLVAGTSGNVSVRLDDGTILVTPTSRSLRALDPGELVRVDAAGAALDRGAPDERASVAFGGVPRAARYRLRGPYPSDVLYGMVEDGPALSLDTVGASESLGPIVSDPLRKAGIAELAERCAEAFANGAETVVMERHG